MKKIIYLFLLLMGVTGCSVESIDSTENLLTADASVKVQVVENPLGFYSGPNLKATVSITNDCDNLYIEIVPTGDDPTDAKLGVFTDGALPEANGGSGNVKTDGFAGLATATDLKWTIPLNEATSFNIFINAWGDWTGAELSEGINQTYISYTADYSGCGDCEESFSYVANVDGSYTFTYVPAEDLEEAEVIFTFAQSVVASGYDWPDWNEKSSTRTEIMSFEACSVNIWTLFLTGDCSGHSGESNLWTDFKVDGDSKKNDATPNITQSCD